MPSDSHNPLPGSDAHARSRELLKPTDLISGALIMPYGALLYAIGGWTVALETAGGVFAFGFAWLVWRGVRDGLKARRAALEAGER